MKKINITIVMLLALVLVFTGCRGEGGVDTTAPPTVTESPAVTTSPETTAEEPTSAPETTECKHLSYVTEEITASCADAQAFAESHCIVCGYSWSVPVPPPAHNYVDGVCKGCGDTLWSDGDVFADPISYDEATELARQYWSPIESGYFVCYASDEMYLLVRPDEVIVDRIYIDRYTGEISVPKLTYPDIPDSLLKVLLNETTYIRQFDYESEEYFKDTVLDYPTAETGSFGYAVCDLDGDGKAELILSSMQYEIVLREFEGKVYGYLFDFRSLLDLKTDGSFNFTSNAGMTYGTARLSFDGTKYVYHELTRRETADDGSISYFVDDKKVTKEEFDAREALLSQEEAPYEHLAIYPLKAWFPGG